MANSRTLQESIALKIMAQVADSLKKIVVGLMACIKLSMSSIQRIPIKACASSWSSDHLEK